MSNLGKTVKEHKFGQNGKNKYPWSNWCDGQVWQIKQGEQFTCSMEAMRSSLSCKSKRSGQTVQYETINKTELIFQFK